MSFQIYELLGQTCGPGLRALALEVHNAPRKTCALNRHAHHGRRSIVGLRLLNDGVVVFTATRLCGSGKRILFALLNQRRHASTAVPDFTRCAIPGGRTVGIFRRRVDIRFLRCRIKNRIGRAARASCKKNDAGYGNGMINFLQFRTPV